MSIPNASTDNTDAKSLILIPNARSLIFISTVLSVVPHAATTMTANAIARHLVNIAGFFRYMLIAARTQYSMHHDQSTGVKTP